MKGVIVVRKKFSIIMLLLLGCLLMLNNGCSEKSPVGPEEESWPWSPPREAEEISLEKVINVTAELTIFPSGWSCPGAVSVEFDWLFKEKFPARLREVFSGDSEIVLATHKIVGGPALVTLFEETSVTAGWAPPEVLWSDPDWMRKWKAVREFVPSDIQGRGHIELENPFWTSLENYKMYVIPLGAPLSPTGR